jgi:CheY-like chemotaxis protein
MTDRTAVPELEELRSKLAAEARERERLEQAIRLADAVAHELKNLLTAISVHAELVQQQLPPGAPSAGDVERILWACRGAAALAGRLREVGLPEPGSSGAESGRAAAPAARADGASALGAGSRGRVLLVEDAAELRDELARALRAAGHGVAAAKSGEEALALLRAPGAPFHVVVTNLALPGMGGAELAERVSRMLPGVAVLFVSGSAGAPGRGLPPGAELLRAPFPAPDLVARVDALLGGRG